ncbi:hypothetical protein [Bacterioplanoides sp. SCSIO 12839]|uniref:capsular polysaccharide export protein, LipB/KpsS family n=1 Tax=Bacterioplanoides sp. SCSIO 12839 TaxID=2829569 RepID=UPI0021050379|nr:hypothetical protein [Bacterioplanoides sp. SCSIO 12839]UTW49489.1 hypothetical protein KFF03_06245 [Bacterioplanoides sp. SCSIO 12839]
MRVLVYGYYDDFANFFLNVRNFHKAINKEAEYFFITPNISGYLTWDDSNKYLIGSKFKFIKNKKSSYERSILADINALSILEGKDANDTIAQKKLDEIGDVFCKFVPDVVVISGDSRPNSRVVRFWADQRNIRMLYFEQGPKGTTLISPYGVTANHIAYSIDNEYSMPSVTPDLVTYNPNRWQRYLDVLQMFSSDLESRFDLAMMLRKKNNKKPMKLTPAKNIKSRLLVVLQVPKDINSIFHGKFFSINQLVIYLDKTVPKEVEIVFREHPMYRGSYDKSLYEYISNGDRLLLDSAEAGVPVRWGDYFSMITVNSLMTFEAIDHGVPVALLGRACYGGLASNCEFHNDLKEFLLSTYKKDKSVPDSDEIERYLKNTFLPGHYRSATKELLSNVAYRIEGTK